MIIDFNNNKVKKLFENDKKLLRIVKDKNKFDSIKILFISLSTSQNLFEVFESKHNINIHELKNDKKWICSLYVINKKSPIRLMFKVKDKEQFANIKSPITLKQINSIELIELSLNHYW